ncbi:MAG: hypothetical protein LBM60_07060 [Clostridium sp.]|nr:hypothetical protein [Clostridium sp.]
MLRSVGERHAQDQWWRERLKELTDIRKSNAESAVIEIDNCSVFTSDVFSQCVSDYFGYFNSKKRLKKFVIRQDASLCFICDVVIREGFLTPIALFSGLMSRYQNNWKAIIDKFVELRFHDKNGMVGSPQELYFTFAWMLWGPSFKLSDENSRIAQFGFGDESNSICVFFNSKDEYLKVFRDMQAYGQPSSVKCKLFESKDYVNKIRDYLSNDSLFFANKLQHGESYIYECEKIDLLSGNRYDDYYYTAYIWVMFEVQSTDIKFNPLKTITFFEHANIADRNNVDFLMERLVEKSVKFFMDVFSDEEKNARKYRLCLAFSNEVTERLRIRYQELINAGGDMADAFKERVSLHSIRDMEDIFTSFDNYFDDSGDEIDYFEVSLDDTETLSLLGTFYTTIYCPAFPDINERETLDNMLHYLRKEEMKGTKNNYHIVLAQNNGHLLGGIIFDYFCNSNVGVIEFITTSKTNRCKGSGREIYQKAVEILRLDSSKAGYQQLNAIICEIDKLLPSNDRDPSYLHFWSKMGFKKIGNFNYIQPSLSETQSDVDTLELICNNLSFKTQDTISTEVLASVITDYAKYAMQLSKPEENNSVRSMLQQLDDKKTLPLVRIRTD